MCVIDFVPYICLLTVCALRALPADQAVGACNGLLFDTHLSLRICEHVYTCVCVCVCVCVSLHRMIVALSFSGDGNRLAVVTGALTPGLFCTL